MEGSTTVNPKGYHTEGDEEGVDGWGRIFMWLCVIGFFIVIVKKARTSVVVVDRTVVKGDVGMQSESLKKAEDDIQKSLKKHRSVQKKTPKEGNTAGKLNSLGVKPGQWVTITDDLCTLYNRSLKVTRTDGQLLEVMTPHSGAVIMNEKYLKKTPPRIEIKWKQHNKPTSVRITLVEPFAPSSDIVSSIAATLQLEPHQFHVIFSGKKLNPREPARHYCEKDLVLTVYVIPEALEPGYIPPAPENPIHAELLYTKLQEKCDVMEEEMKSNRTPPAGVATGSFPELEMFVRSYDIVVVDFFAPWCGPCRQIAPIFSEIAGSYRGRIGFFSIDADSHTQAKAKYSIAAFPTFIVFKQGSVLTRLTGADPERLRNLVESL